MSRLTRRQFVAAAAAMGASVAWVTASGCRSRTAWQERRDLFAEGVASGDPTSDSVILWTRVPLDGKAKAVPLTVEVAEDEAFEHVVATARANATAAADYTCRVLVGGLQPSRVYWYRFSTRDGEGSRIGRTRTAPAPGEDSPVRFAFVSCQNPCEGALNAYRRMIFEDERAAPAEQLAFVLHLGDFIYEVVDYPEDTPNGQRYDRKLRDLIRYQDGEKIPQGFQIATSLADYRQLYRVYLHDPDLQDARARFPFVAIWDNHEFSWLGWQSFQRFGDESKPRPTRKVFAMQAWFEYQPARVVQSGGKSLEQFTAPQLHEAPITKFDEQGLGIEPNNLAAINALQGYRRLTFGKHLDLIITDQYSFRSEEPTAHPEAEAFSDEQFAGMFPQEVNEILDGGRAYANGHPPDTIDFGGKKIPNFRRSAPPQSILGVEQKQWFLSQLRSAQATWKVWGASLGTLDYRVDPQNLPAGPQRSWPGAGYASFGGGDFGAAFTERAELYDAVRDAGITGFLTVSGDRHSFWAGLAAKALPPKDFEPVGAAFITGSISSPGMVEANEHRFPKDHPLRALFLTDGEGQGKPEPAVNMLLRHGVRSCLEYRRSHDLEAARKLSNPDLSPHLSFVDMGGHGYAVLRVARDQAECEFVCIPRPLERAGQDGGPLRYRVVHRVALWSKGERPALETRVLEGDPGLAL